MISKSVQSQKVESVSSKVFSVAQRPDRHSLILFQLTHSLTKMPYITISFTVDWRVSRGQSHQKLQSWLEIIHWRFTKTWAFLAFMYPLAKCTFRVVLSEFQRASGGNEFCVQLFSYRLLWGHAAVSNCLKTNYAWAEIMYLHSSSWSSQSKSNFTISF